MNTTKFADNKPKLPHIAYVVLWYPVFTQPFIFREVEGLRKAGLPLDVYSLYSLSLRKCSEEMRSAASRTYTLGIKATGIFLLEFLLQLVTHPIRIAGLFKKTVLRRWLGFESFAEVLWGFLAGIHLARIFKEASIDIIHAPWPRGPATAAWVASELSGIPFSIAARGDNLNPAEPDLIDKMKASLFIRANNKADMQRMQEMLSPASQVSIEQSDKIDLVYNSLTMTVGAAVAAHFAKPVKLLAVGRFSPTKGFEYLLEACKILKDNNFSFKLTLIGGGGLSTGGYLGPRFKKMRQEFGLVDFVDMPGLVSHDQLPRYLADSDIFVAPCVISTSGQRDGIPNAIIEAMAFAVPVISTEVNAIPEIVINNETGYLVPQRDANALAMAIMCMAQNPENARKMATQGRILVSQMFDEKSNVTKLMAMFSERYKKLSE